MILADSGYVSREFFYELQDVNIYLVAKPRANIMADNEAGICYFPF
jgi:hypothetical protein